MQTGTNLGMTTGYPTLVAEATAELYTIFGKFCFILFFNIILYFFTTLDHRHFLHSSYVRCFAVPRVRRVPPLHEILMLYKIRTVHLSTFFLLTFSQHESKWERVNFVCVKEEDRQ